MNDFPFSSVEAFRGAFESGLSELLQHGGLGPFILACANATFDPHLHERIESQLIRQHALLQKEVTEALRGGRDIQVVEEDLLVFLKIQAVGMTNLGATERRTAGIWEVQFNHLRSFRPKRISVRIPGHLHIPFDEEGFHFNKGFMQKEAFWAGELCGRHVTLYYNKYPFVDFHGLLVPERESCLPQYLTEAHHFYVWDATQELARALEGAGFGYNSLGAFASVNHLHFQMFLKPEGFPVMNPRWRHGGGDVSYPGMCEVFDDARSAWACIHRLHEQEIPYNLLYVSGRIYVFPRRKQGTCAQPSWSSGFTWHELAGGMVTFNRDDYEQLDEAGIARELARLAPAV